MVLLWVPSTKLSAGRGLHKVSVISGNSWGAATVFSVLEMTSYIVKTKRHIFFCWDGNEMLMKSTPQLPNVCTQVDL